MSKNIMILASNFSPYDGSRIGSSIRVFTMSGFLARSGYKVHVVLPVRYCKDGDFPILHKNIKVYRYFSLFQYFDHTKNLKFYLLIIKKGISVIEKITKKIFIDPKVIYSYFIVAFIKRIINKNDISIVISSSPPLTLAGYALKLKLFFKDKILWILDLRDIVSMHPTIRKKKDAVRKRQEKNEIRMIDASDKCLVVSIGMYNAVNSLLVKYSMVNNKNKFQIIENGFDYVKVVKPQSEIEVFVNKARKENRIVLVYAGTGSLDDDQKKGKKLNYFVDILVSDRYLSNKYALVIQGVVKNSKKHFENLKTSLMYLALPPVNNAQMRANLLLCDIGLNVNDDVIYSPIIIAGKVCDYCVSKLSIIVIFPQNADSLQDFSQKHNNKPYFADVFDKESIIRVLKEIVDNPNALEKRKFTYEEMIPHSRDNQYKKILDLIQ